MSKESFLAKHNIVAKQFIPVQGGDINLAWRVETGNEIYFLKENKAAIYPGMMKLEAEGLQALSEESGLPVPAIIASGEEGGQQFLLLQWLEKSGTNASTWQDFGHRLATMHQKPQSYFGWEKNNYIGSLTQRNAIKDNWADFYCQYRISPLVEEVYEQGLFTKYDLAAIQKLCLRIPLLFPRETPSLLHGDLWNGNFLFGPGGEAHVFDPAVYFGHREMDLGMTKLFGGFDSTFYAAYHETYPLESGWQERVQLTQLYPVLVHARLFGGHYAQQAIAIIKQYS